MIDLNWVETILWTDLLSWLESQWKDRQAPNLVVYPLCLHPHCRRCLHHWQDGWLWQQQKINHCDESFAILLPIASLCCITGCCVGDWVESVYNWHRPFSSSLHNKSSVCVKTTQGKSVNTRPNRVLLSPIINLSFQMVHFCSMPFQ